MYTMVEIPEDDWELLPDVDDQWRAEAVSKEVAKKLHSKGYIPGLINSNDASPDARNGAAGVHPARSLAWMARPGDGYFCITSRRSSRRSTGSTLRLLRSEPFQETSSKRCTRSGARVMRLDAVPF